MRDFKKDKPTNRKDGIIAYCRECCGDDTPRKCTAYECFLYPFRIGDDPFRKRAILTEKQKVNLFSKKENID